MIYLFALSTIKTIMNENVDLKDSSQRVKPLTLYRMQVASKPSFIGEKELS